MCYFITATLPEGADADRVREIARRHNLAWVPVDNPDIQNQLRRGESYFVTADKHCQCGTALGESRRESEPKPPDYFHQLKTLRKQGWSETRIGRWLEQKQDRRQRKAEKLRGARAAELDNWVSFIRTVIEVGAARSLGLLLHFYRTGPATETIRMTRRVQPAGKLGADDLFSMDEDVLYEFAR
jgi:hypothetical protein